MACSMGRTWVSKAGIDCAGSGREPPLPVGGATAEDDAVLDEERRLVRDAIDRLPENYRTVLVLRDIEQVDTKEAATMLDISESLVKTRLHRARQALRSLLDPHFRKEVA